MIPTENGPIPKRRPKRLRARRIPLTMNQILAWADDHFARTGGWPHVDSGPVLANPNETWKAIGMALIHSGRGLEVGLTLAQLLARERGVRNKKALPPLTHAAILAWASEHHGRTGQWPTEETGPVAAAPGEVWATIDVALRSGRRGLAGGDSLPRLLLRRLGARNRRVFTTPLTIESLLAWADSHFAKSGEWPNTRSKAVLDAPNEDWHRIDNALRKGSRGLPGGSTLAQFLARFRDVRNPVRPPDLSVLCILDWADDYHRSLGCWPGQNSGPVAGAPSESWKTLDGSLRVGNRGLPGGSSLAQLLAQHRGVRNLSNVPPLTVEGVLTWADAHFASFGDWPSASSGLVANAPGENWAAINTNLRIGGRTLPGGDTLSKLLDRHRRRSGK